MAFVKNPVIHPMNDPIGVLLFHGSTKKFSVYCKSITQAARVLNRSASSINQAFNGKHSITCGGYYVRYGTWDDAIEAGTLEEFDRIHGIKARYFNTRAEFKHHCFKHYKTKTDED